MKEYVAKEMQQVNNNLAKDFDLHLSQYQELLFRVSDIQSSFDQEKKTLAEQAKAIQQC